MRHLRNITKVFENAPQLVFDDSSKFVLMSDCHRSDGSASDNFIHNRNIALTALKYYYDQRFTYIELGDGDELWENKNFQIIATANVKIFEVLALFHKAGRLYFIFGNHDIVKKNKPCLYEGFPNIKFYEGIVLTQKNSGYKILLLHGHQADFLNYSLWPLSRFLVRHLWKPLELIGIKDPLSAEKNDITGQRLRAWTDKNKYMLIAGHTHKTVFPKPGESLYFNDGCCVYPYSISAIEITNGGISLVKWSIKARHDGVLYVGRDILENQEKLSDYFKPLTKAVAGLPAH